MAGYESARLITLHSFVGVDPEIVNIHLFRHFCSYYRRIGVDALVFDLQSNWANEARFQAFRAVAEEFGAEIRNIVRERYASRGNQLDYTNSFMREHTDDWCLLADVDEFIRFPMPLAQFFRQCDRVGANLVRGRLIDRIARDFSFPEIGEGSLDEMFPLAYPMTRHIRQGTDRKIVAYRGRFTSNEGHHGFAEESGFWTTKWPARFVKLTRFPLGILPRAIRPHACPFGKSLEVHHFAWDSLLREKMEDRKLTKIDHLPELVNVLAYVSRSDRRDMLDANLLRETSLSTPWQRS
jgi:hypothetical protein